MLVRIIFKGKETKLYMIEEKREIKMNEEEQENYLRRQIVKVEQTVETMQKELKTFLLLKQLLIIGIIVSVILSTIALWTIVT